jgi:hypothetical protein
MSVCKGGAALPILPPILSYGNQSGFTRSCPSQCSSTFTPIPTARATVPQVPDPLAHFQHLLGFSPLGQGLFAQAIRVPLFSAKAFTSLVLRAASCQGFHPSEL